MNRGAPEQGKDGAKGAQLIKLQKEHELRIEVEHGKTVELQLVKGSAEIFGAELAPNKNYCFSGTNFAVFTWEGAEIQMDGSCAQQYIADETPMTKYLEIHMRMEQKRNEGVGPRIMVVGPGTTGKSSLCKILASYAVRVGRQHLLVDLDVVGQHVSTPGVIAAVQLVEPIDILEGFSMLSPLTYFYGHGDSTTVLKNPDLFKILVEKMAECLELKMHKDNMLKQGGMIINTGGYMSMGYDLMLHAATTFKVTNILVLGDDRITSNLKRDLKKHNIEIEKVPTSGGVYSRSASESTAELRKIQMQKIREYFYGTIVSPLCPHSIVMKFDEVTICSIGSDLIAPLSALPIGAQSAIGPTDIREVEPTNKTIVHSLLGLSSANKKEDVLTSNLLGLVYIENVDVNKKEITLLAPSPGKLIKRFLLLGSLKWLQ